MVRGPVLNLVPNQRQPTVYSPRFITTECLVALLGQELSKYLGIFFHGHVLRPFEL
jgi:hypothetical protein